MESGPAEGQKKSLLSQQGQGGGIAPKVDPQAWESWRDHLQRQPCQHFTSQQLAQCLFEQTGIRYSHSHFCSLLRHQQGMYYYKPRPMDYHRSEQAQEQLDQRLKATVDALGEMGYDLQRVKWGFIDEVAVQMHTNNSRFWAFEPALSRIVCTQPKSRSFFGFYGLNAVSHLHQLEDGTQESIKSALLAVKAQQSDLSAMVVIADNARSHHALETWGWERQIYFVWLPAYSPDLNPIEKVWKSTKRGVTQWGFIDQMSQLSTVFMSCFEQVKSQVSFLTSWWEMYESRLTWYSTILNSNTSQ